MIDVSCMIDVATSTPPSMLIMMIHQSTLNTAIFDKKISERTRTTAAARRQSSSSADSTISSTRRRRPEGR